MSGYASRLENYATVSGADIGQVEILQFNGTSCSLCKAAAHPGSVLAAVSSARDPIAIQN